MAENNYNNENQDFIEASHSSQEWMHEFLKYTLVFYDHIYSILSQNIDYYKKKEMIGEIFSSINQGHYFDELQNLVNNYLDGKINEDDFQKKFELFREQNINDAKSRLQAYFAALHKNEEVENTKKSLMEIMPHDDPKSKDFFENFDNLNSAQLEEVVLDFNNPFNASLSEETMEDLKLDRKTGDKIKTQYKYKVEGKISSGISELDEFLGIIQPGLNLLLIGVGRIFYEGVVDNVEKLFFSNPDKGIVSYYENWAKSSENIKKAFDFLHNNNYLDENDKFHYRVNLENNENHIATAFNNMVVDKINLNRQSQLKNLNDTIKNDLLSNNQNLTDEQKRAIIESSDITQSKEFNLLSEDEKNEYLALKEQYQPFKGNAFNKLKDMTETTHAVQEIIKDTIRKTRDVDDKGNPIPKATDKGKSALNSIMYLVDLFNKDNDSAFYNKFSSMINYYKSEYTSTSFGNFIEDDSNDYFVKQQESEEQEKAIKNFINAMGGEEKVKAMMGGESR